MSINKPNPHDTIVVLANLFPACFSVFQQRWKPLKVSIRDDVSDRRAAFMLIGDEFQRLCGTGGRPGENAEMN
jgi:hypothetical protein